MLLVAVLAGQVWCSNPVVERILGSRKVLSTLYFSDNSYVIDADGRIQLEMLVDILREEIARGRFVRAEGFASNEGRDIYSFKLSLQRAKSVIDYYHELDALPEIYLTGYGDLKDSGDNPKNEWRVEIASYENLVDVRMVKKKKKPTMLAQPKESAPPISSKSLQEFKLGHMEALSKFDEPLIIDALAVEQALMEKLGTPPAKPTGTVTQVSWSER